MKPESTLTESQTAVFRPESNILNIPVEIEVIIGSKRLKIEEVLELVEGSIIRLNKSVSEPADIAVNGKVLARGNIIVIEDDSTQLGVVITEIL